MPQYRFGNLTISVNNLAGEVRLTTPLLIRIMEWCRESAPDDLSLHEVADKLQALQSEAGDAPLDADIYPELGISE